MDDVQSIDGWLIEVHNELTECYDNMKGKEAALVSAIAANAAATAAVAASIKYLADSYNHHHREI